MVALPLPDLARMPALVPEPFAVMLPELDRDRLAVPEVEAFIPESAAVRFPTLVIVVFPALPFVVDCMALLALDVMLPVLLIVTA